MLGQGLKIQLHILTQTCLNFPTEPHLLLFLGGGGGGGYITFDKVLGWQWYILLQNILVSKEDLLQYQVYA